MTTSRKTGSFLFGGQEEFSVTFLSHSFLNYEKRTSKIRKEIFWILVVWNMCSKNNKEDKKKERKKDLLTQFYIKNY